MRKRSRLARAPALAAACAVLLSASACREILTVKTKIDIPAVPAVKLDGITEIAIGDFLVETPSKEFEIGPALTGYLRDEIKPEFKGRLSAIPVSWSDAAQADRPEAWTGILTEPKDKLILTGRVQYVQDVRKALVAKDRRAIDDGPFAPETPWSERKNFEIKLDVYVIQAETGETLLKRNFTESVIVENRRQTPEFAFYELLQRVRLKLFRLLFGTVRNQERYLLAR
jgi:xanthosine utilization system XapX-like protein